MFTIDSGGTGRFDHVIKGRKFNAVELDVFLTAPGQISLGRVAEREKQVVTVR